MTESMCMPHPRQVILPQLEQRAGLHIGKPSSSWSAHGGIYPMGYPNQKSGRAAASFPLISAVGVVNRGTTGAIHHTQSARARPRWVREVSGRHTLWGW